MESNSTNSGACSTALIRAQPEARTAADKIIVIRLAKFLRFMDCDSAIEMAFREQFPGAPRHGDDRDMNRPGLQGESNTGRGERCKVY